MTPLKTIRLDRGHTLEEIASAVGTDRSNLSRIENHRHQASPDLAAKLAKFFGYAITEIQILYPERFTENPSESAA